MVSTIKRARAAETDQASASWAEFCSAVSGEWEGVSATFDPTGKPVELPPQFVPDAYREWEMHLYDWQTQCSTLADGDSLLCKVKRLMPTVGCEADAVAFNEEHKVSKIDDSSDSLAAVYLSDGSYSIPADFSAGSMAYAEHCFAIGEEQRLRIIHVFRDLATGWGLSSIEVHKERKEGPYNGGNELAGCGGGMPSFAEKARLADKALEGNWEPVADAFLERGATSPQSGGASDIIRLPLDSWAAYQQTEGGWILHAGCILGSDERCIAVHESRGGQLVSVAFGRQLRRD